MCTVKTFFLHTVESYFKISTNNFNTLLNHLVLFQILIAVLRGLTSPLVTYINNSSKNAYLFNLADHPLEGNSVMNVPHPL